MTETDRGSADVGDCVNAENGVRVGLMTVCCKFFTQGFHEARRCGCARNGNVLNIPKDCPLERVVCQVAFLGSRSSGECGMDKSLIPKGVDMCSSGNRQRRNASQGGLMRLKVLVMAAAEV